MEDSDSNEELAGQLTMGIDDFLEHCKENGAEDAAQFFEMVLLDYYKGDQSIGSHDDRYFTVEGTDVSGLVELSIIFGTIWEREDPGREVDESDEDAE